MKISDRDKKLILFVLLVAIIALPIFFFIRPKNEQIKAMDNDLVSLNERYNYLKDLSAKQPEYERLIGELNAKRDEMIKDFAGGIKLENTIMFLRNIEISDNPVYMSVISFGDAEETQVTEAYVDETGSYVDGLTALKVPTTITYSADYKDIKEFLNYIFTYKDKMSVSRISMTLDRGTNQITGVVVVDQYAISGNGREVEKAPIPSMLHGTDRLFELIYDEEGNLLTKESALGIAIDEELEEEVEVDLNEEVTE